MPAPQPILDLVARFHEHHDAYKSGVYNETQLRRDFLDPFFRELGWDVDNTAGYAESYRDVIHEDQIKVGGAVKAPDYGFRIGGQRKFFLEAKKPSVQIKTDISPAYQLRRYAWSARLPLSILSDFEEFAIYDTRIKPGVNDPAAKARIFYCRYDEYPRHWDTLASIFSRDAILRGGFDKYAATTRGKRGTAEVDSDFLATIEGWRADLASNIALRNPALTQRELNFAVQRVLDRIIFLRICEDRGIEDYERLKKATDGKNIYASLVQLFQQADVRYNSGLFHFHAEKGRGEDLDTLTPGLVIDDALLKPLIRGLYYPDSPYEFSVLSADILGQVYEQFLGKVISLTPGHRARVEDKPEVKKAGGVFYTPTYIVDYIVRQTVGPLLDGKTPRQIESVRVLDPACGSGSFLIGAYQFLLDWYHRHYTSADPDKHARGKNPVLVAAPGGGWMLTTNERKRILLAHIYGVDIDSQAVEVTKLSLLLKVLEGETAQTVQRELIHERVLPDLAGNIKCGNSLIASDFYAQPDLPAMDPDAHLRVNVFDWSGPHGFPHIMKDCGFDAIIGNPPYVRIQTLQESNPASLEYFKKNYAAAARGNYDIYVLFIERSLKLLNTSGELGFILPHKFFNSDYGGPVRNLLAKDGKVRGIVHFGAQQVFAGATTYTCLLFLRAASQPSFTYTAVNDLQEWAVTHEAQSATLQSEKLSSDIWNFSIAPGAELREKLGSMPTKLGDVAQIFVGLQTSADDVFMLDYVGAEGKRLRLESKVLGETVVLEDALLHPVISGTDVQGYPPLGSRQFILFPYEVQDEKANLLPFSEIQKRYPLTAAYLAKNRQRLEQREKGKFRDESWYRFGRSQNLGIQNRVKVCVPRLVDRLCAAFDHDGTHFLDNVDVGGVTLTAEYSHLGYQYLMAVLNSRLMGWYFPSISAPFRGGWMSANRQFLSKVPIRPIDPKSKTDLASRDRIIALVDQTLSLHTQRTHAKTPHEQTALDRQLSATDSALDREVYTLYGLTDDEIRLVEQ